MEEMNGMEPETYGVETRAEVNPIVAKALQCIDEVYPDGNTLNEGHFPTDAFINEMVRWVIDIVPSHELTKRTALTLAGASADEEGMGTAKVANVGRIVYFKVNNWKRPVFGVITENDPRYIQQRNKVLRGNASRPIVALVEGRSVLEWWPAEGSVSYTAKHVPYSIGYIPENLEDLAAWKLAEIVLMSMSDAQAAAVCTAKVNEHLEILAL